MAKEKEDEKMSEEELERISEIQGCASEFPMDYTPLLQEIARQLAKMNSKLAQIREHVVNYVP